MPNLGTLGLELDALSRRPEVTSAYQADPLNYLGKTKARTGVEMMRTITSLPPPLTSLDLPLLLIHGGADRLVPPSASELVQHHADSVDLTRKVYDRLYHEPHNEPERDQVLGDVLDWLNIHLSPAIPRP